MNYKAACLASKYPLRSTVAATAVAAAGIGAVGTSASAAPWADALGGLASAGHTASASSGDHTTTAVFESVRRVKHAQAIPASQQQTSVGVHLDSHQVPGFVGRLAADAPPVPSRGDGILGALGIPTAAYAQAPAAATPAHAKQAPAHAAPAKTAPPQYAPAHAKQAPAHAAPAPAAPAPAAPAPAAPAPAAPGHAAPVHGAPGHGGSAHGAVHVASVHAAPVHAARHAKAPAPEPYLIYDSVTPGQIPAGHNVATYANGAYAASASSVAGRGHVLWIDTNGSDPNADALDVEPGDATPYGAAQWVQAKLHASPGSVAIVYTMISDWQSVRDNVAALPRWMQSHVRYWIADPTGIPHVLPGSNATQWYWGNSYDITTANPGFQS